MADQGAGPEGDTDNMNTFAAISFLLNALVGVFLLYCAITDLYGDNVDPDDDRGVLGIMLAEGAALFLFGVAGLLFI